MVRTPAHPARLVALAALAAVTAAPASAQTSAFALRGTIRDFRTDHPDFAVAPTGHYPGNINFALPASGAPAYTDFGFEAIDQWRDRLARPIAPHMYNAGHVVVEVVSAPSMDAQSYADSFDSFAGPYDPAAAGPTPQFLTGSPMPVVTEPTLSVPFTDIFRRDTNGTSTLSTDVWCNIFTISNHHTLKIAGDITIIANTEFKLQNYARVELLPGARLTIYVKNTATIQDMCELNRPGDPNRVRIFNLGTTDLKIQNQSHVYATLVSPSAGLQMKDGAHFYGKVTARTVAMQNQSGLHIDGIPSLCAIAIEDVAGLAGSKGGAITDADSFTQWFNDAIGVNASKSHTVVMRDWGAGYEHRDDSFYPIDGKLYGNEGQAHNGYFTYDVSAAFIYEACTNQVISFEGDDDCWIFIDNRLVIDLGGVQPGTPQAFEVDRLNLVDGETYSFRLFYAHRNTGQPRFNLRTTFELYPEPQRAGLAGYPSHD